MFKLFLPSEFKAPEEDPTNFVPYREQLRKALEEDNIRELIDNHIQRWEQCDLNDIRKALGKLDHFIAEKESELEPPSFDDIIKNKELEELEEAKEALEVAKMAISMQEYSNTLPPIHTRLLNQEQCQIFRRTRKETLEAAIYFRTTILSDPVRPETILMAYSLFNFGLEKDVAFLLSCVQEECLENFVNQQNKNIVEKGDDVWEKGKTFVQNHIHILSLPTIYDFLDAKQLDEDLKKNVMFFMEMAYFGEDESPKTSSYGTKPSVVTESCIYLAHIKQGKVYKTTFEVKEFAANVIYRARGVLSGECAEYFTMNYPGCSLFNERTLTVTTCVPIEFTKEDVELPKEGVELFKRGAYGDIIRGKYGSKNAAIKRMVNLKELLFCGVREIAALSLLGTGTKDCPVVHFFNYKIEAKGKFMATAEIFIYLELAQSQTIQYPQFGEQHIVDLAGYLIWSHENWDHLDACKQIINAVHYCHENMIMHRDLKPHNILVFPSEDGNFTFKLTDFGLARKFHHSKRTYSLQVVTRWWRAPELCLHISQYSCAIDVWSTGIILSQIVFPPNIDNFTGEEDEQFIMLCKTFGFPAGKEWAMRSPMYQKEIKKWIKWKHNKKKKDTYANSFIFKDNCFVNARENISHNLAVVIRGMLEMNPAQRMTMSEALNTINDVDASNL